MFRHTCGGILENSFEKFEAYKLVDKKRLGSLVAQYKQEHEEKLKKLEDCLAKTQTLPATSSTVTQSNTQNLHENKTKVLNKVSSLSELVILYFDVMNLRAKSFSNLILSSTAC